MTTNNDITNDRITNALKGDKEAYRNNWERIFGKTKEEMKEHMNPITGDVPHDIVDNAEDTLDEITQMNEDMGLYDDRNTKT